LAGRHGAAFAEVGAGAEYRGVRSVEEEESGAARMALVWSALRSKRMTRFMMQ
jgi:hypothetical protein